MANSWIWIALIIAALNIMSNESANVTDASDLYDSLLVDYNPNLLPVIEIDDVTVISVGVGIIGISKFDEISGEIELTCRFRINWTDERLIWKTSDHSDIRSLLVPSTAIWRPNLYLVQSMNMFQSVGSAPVRERLYSSGRIIWLPTLVFKVMCSVDVTFFPFDTQTCILTLSSAVYTRKEMELWISNQQVDLSLLTPNSQWNVTSAYVYNMSTLDNDAHFHPFIDIELQLKRRCDFFVVYVVIPVITLGTINVFVFSMPASFGERTSVAMTTFLSFIVSMEMINANVPASSAPIASIYFYNLFLLLYSALIMLLSILSLRIYDREDEVPENVAKMIKCLNCWNRPRRKSAKIVENKVSDNTVLNETDMKDGNFDIGNENGTADPEVTWKVVGKTFDRFCFVILASTFILNTCISFYKLHNNVTWSNRQ